MLQVCVEIRDMLFIVALGLIHGEQKNELTKFKNLYVFDFLSQEQMGRAYAQADICLVRGGATTLAEAKLFGCKLFIVPLPITHDQQKNALFYAEKYGDILFDQSKKSFLVDVQDAFIGHQ